MAEGTTYQSETTTVLAGAASFSGSQRSARAPSPYAYFVAESYSDQAGTLFVEKSQTGTSGWIPVNGTSGLAVAAVTTGTVKCNIVAPYYRARYVNGATLQTTFSLDTSFTTA